MSAKKYIDIPAPNKKQKLFFTDEHKYVAYGGAVHDIHPGEGR